MLYFCTTIPECSSNYTFRSWACKFLEHNWYVASILKGVKRVKGCHSEQKLPITLDILKRLVCHLNLTLPLDRVFWAACLVAFYSFFRKSNLLIPTLDAFDPSRHLGRSDVNFRPDGAVLTVRWSKVIQFRERTLLIPLPLIKNSLFLPLYGSAWSLSQYPSAEGPSSSFQLC